MSSLPETVIFIALREWQNVWDVFLQTALGETICLRGCYEMRLDAAEYAQFRAARDNLKYAGQRACPLQGAEDAI